MYGRVILLGASQGGEVWSCGFTFDCPGASDTWDQSIGDTQVAAIAGVSLGATMLLALSTSLSITGYRWEGRSSSDDHLVGASEKILATPTPGTGSAKMAPQNAVTISLRTGTPGASGRGRIYWPAVGMGLGTNLRLDPTGGTGPLSTQFKTYISGLRSAIEASGGLFASAPFAVRSRKTHTTPHVNQLQVGDVVDTQRRRRDHLAEAYASVAIP